jgi:hypothetical protein
MAHGAGGKVPGPVAWHWHPKLALANRAIGPSVEVERVLVVSRIRGDLLRRPVPDLPKAVNICVMEPEDRIESRGLHLAHEAVITKGIGIFGARVVAADLNVHIVVRLQLNATCRVSAVIKSGI